MKNGDTNNIEINVEEGDEGFVFQLWNFPPNRLSLSVTSPTGEFIERVPPKNNVYTTTKLTLENTIVTIGYEFPKNKMSTDSSTGSLMGSASTPSVLAMESASLFVFPVFV